MAKFLSYILNMRGVAIFIVVAVHARGNLSEWQESLGVHTFLATFFDSREGVGTATFMFIGGFLFQYITHNNWNFKKYLEKKFLFVILPYILISIPIIAYRIITDYSFALPPGFNDYSVTYRFLYYLLTGLHLAPFWFISAIVLFYIAAPVFHALDNPKAYKFIFPLLLLLSFFTYRSLNNANTLISFLHYFPLYYMGMWASYYRTTILSSADKILYPLLFVYGAITVANFTGWLPVRERISFEEILQQGTLLFNIDLLRVVLVCFILMLLLYKFQEKRLLFFEILGEYSFGIFFVHCIFIYATKRAWVELFGPINFSVISYTLYVALMLLMSTASVYFIKKMTGRYSRHLIGS